jgi:hypothetical protein
MLPPPAAIAAAPSPSSRASWNPAVPPPPVGGAAVGNGVALSVVGGLYDADGLCVGDPVNVGSEDGVVLVPSLGVPAPAESLPEAVTEGVVVLPGVDEVEPDVQPATATDARMVKAPQPMTVRRTLSAAPAMVVRTFIKPSSCARQATVPFPVPAS